MARPKEVITTELVKQAEADINSFSGYKVGLRLQAIVSCASHPLETVSAVLGVSRQTVWRWIKRYRAEGVEGLKDKPRGHNPRKLADDQIDQIRAWLNTGQDAQGRTVHWTLGQLVLAIKNEYGIQISQTALWKLIRKIGFKQKVPRPSHAKADPKAQEDFKKNSI
jgi:putative transposase